LNQERLKSTLEVATNIAVLLVALTVLSVFAVNYFLKPSLPHLRPGLQKGATLASIPTLDYRSNKKTLLIALDTNCHFCKESLPFYRKLLEANVSSQKVLRIVAIFPNAADDVAKYIRENDLSIDTIPGVPLNSLGLSGTPSLLLLNQKGEVKDFWIGKLPSTETDELIRSLTSSDLND
jgi:hypothetical protein